MSTEKIESILMRPYKQILVRQESGRYYAKISEFEGCHASGADEAEALRNLNEAAEDWIESEIEQGHDIPMPEQDEVYSGKFLTRISPVVHRELVQNADRYGISLNQYVGQKLAARAAEDTLVFSILDKLSEMSVAITPFQKQTNVTQGYLAASLALETNMETKARLGS